MRSRKDKLSGNWNCKWKKKVIDLLLPVLNHGSPVKWVLLDHAGRKQRKIFLSKNYGVLRGQSRDYSNIMPLHSVKVCICKDDDDYMRPDNIPTPDHETSPMHHTKRKVLVQYSYIITMRQGRNQIVIVPFVHLRRLSLLSFACRK